MDSHHKDDFNKHWHDDPSLPNPLIFAAIGLVVIGGLMWAVWEVLT